MNGYTRIPNELMRNPNLPPIAKVVWSLIAGMNPRFSATLNQFCTMVACHPDTWRSTVKMLESFGMVSVEHLPNGVKYSAITDTSKWSIPNKEGMKISHPMKNSKGMKNSHPKGMKISEGEGMKISHPMKNSKDMKNSHPKGMKISEGEGMKISHPSEDYIEEQKNTTTTISACAREKLVEELLTDGRIELAMMQHHITVEQYRHMVNDIIADWQFRGLPDSDYNLSHFSSVMRIMVEKLNRKNGNNQQAGQPSDPRTKLDQDAVKAMAALAAESRQPKIVPF